MTKQTTVFVIGRGIRTLKPDADFNAYCERHPSAIKVRKPSIAKLENWEYDGICPTPDGCRVEPDGHCEHGYPSWIEIMLFGAKG